MSFGFATPWNAWVFVSPAVVAAFALLSVRMAARSYRVARNLLLLVLAAALLVYGAISWGGLFVFGGRVGTFERQFYVAPVISPLVMLIAPFSVRWAAALAWLIFLFLQSYYIGINWPSLYGMAMALSFDWPIWSAALLLSVVAIRDKQRSFQTHAVAR